MVRPIVRSYARESQSRGAPRSANAALLFAAPLLGAALLSACAVGPDYRRPADPAADVFASHALIESSDAAVLQRWWEQFGDPLLNEVITQTLAANRDLRAAGAALDEARAQRKEGALDFLPGAQGTAARTKSLLAPFNQPGLTRDARKRDAHQRQQWQNQQQQGAVADV